MIYKLQSTIDRLERKQIDVSNKLYKRSPNYMHDKEELTRLEDFFENNIMPMHQVDEAGFIVNANKADYTNLGYSREEYIGSHSSKHFASKTTYDFIIKELEAFRPLWKVKAKLVRKDGSIVNVSITSTYNGGLTRCIIIPE